MLPQRRDQKDDGRSFFLILFNFEVFQTQRKKKSGFRRGKIYGAKNLFGAKCKRATCALDNYSPCVLGFRAVGTKGAGGGAIALPDFDKYVNPILNSGVGGQIMLIKSLIASPGFLDFPSTLCLWLVF